MKEKLRTWIEVDKKALKSNVDFFRSWIDKKVQLLAVVKSNAYGHGLNDFAKTMESFGVDMIAVDSVVEGLAIRKEGITLPILTLGYVLPSMLHDAQEYDIAVTVSSFEGLESLLEVALEKPLSVHIKVDTGMHRQGFLLNDADRVIAEVKKMPEKVKIVGVYTHFASAKNPTVRGVTDAQIAEFNIWRKKFSDAGLSVVTHASATSGTLVYPEAHFDMVRVGIGMYGYAPAEAVASYLGDRLRLTPALTWKTIISEVKTLPKGGRVGYDQAGSIDPGGAVAVCPVGYWHGYPRTLSGLGRVLVGGRVARVVGRVSMDMITIDVSGIDVSVGDEVTLLSATDDRFSAEAVSALADTISYEFITQINPLIKRFYI